MIAGHLTGLTLHDSIAINYQLYVLSRLPIMLQ